MEDNEASQIQSKKKNQGRNHSIRMVQCGDGFVRCFVDLGPGSRFRVPRTRFRILFQYPHISVDKDYYPRQTYIYGHLVHQKFAYCPA